MRTLTEGRSLRETSHLPNERWGPRCLPGLLLLACLGCGTTADAPRPNFLVLIADDQTGGTLGAAGDPMARTPALDRLASAGVRFSNSFVTTSLCSPARASLLTGQYARRHGVSDNTRSLPPATTTFASVLRDAGYHTGYIGKWHLGNGAASRPGFDYTASFAGQGRYVDCPFYVGGKVRSTTGHVDDVSTRFAIDFLRAPRNQPFLLVVGFKGLHVPRTPPQRFEGLFEDTRFPAPESLEALAPYPRRHEYAALSAGEDPGRFALSEAWSKGIDRSAHQIAAGQLQKAARKYYRSLAAVDDDVGQLLDVLDELSLTDDTVVVYVGDNGIHLYAHGMVGKRSAYDESMRVETIVRYPKLITRSRTLDELVLNVDLAPTLLDLAGIPVPRGMQGRSWRPLLETGDPSVAGWRDAFVYEYYRGNFLFLPTMFALRTHSAKLVHYPDYPSWTELFDLEDDPHETSNRAGDPARSEQLAGLIERLGSLEREIGPRLDSR